MDFLARFIHWATYDRIAYEPIREDFISWYYSAYQDLPEEEKLQLDNNEIVTMAIEARDEAIQYEPNTPLNSAIQVTNEAKSVIGLWTAIVGLTGATAGTALFGLSLSNLVSGLVSLIMGLFGGALLGVFAPLLPLYVILKHTIETNGELIRLYNQDLVVSVGRIQRDKRKADVVIAYYFHNSGLCSTSTLPAVIILGIIRVASPWLYGIISNELKSNITEYRTENFRRAVRKQYARIRKQELV
ncbi:hypothetical protein [Haloarchaeobius sp. HRN-SO-5]|uniref:hypothetical protein n=1 Tax=Haloarchaeobius sp. HRN-SO-5 TaxID=3446118 RepID=UPI003EBB6251